jgi:hypothetical protein
MALPNFPIDKSYLVAAWLASAMWGAFSITFFFWLVTTIQRRKTSSINYVTTALVFCMYTLATAHISLVLERILYAFIIAAKEAPDGAIFYLADIAEPINRSKDMIYVSLIILGDSTLVWRCFVVWGKNYWIILAPSLMILGTAISGYGAIAQFFLPHPFTLTGIEWATGMLTVSMATNIIVTALTAGRVWFMASQIPSSSFSSSRHTYRQVILLIIESGLVMTLSKVLEFVFFKLGPVDGLNGFNGLYVVMDSMPQIMGICPTFIILSVNRGFTSGNGSTNQMSSGTANASGTSSNRLQFAVRKDIVEDSTFTQSTFNATASYPLQYLPQKQDV